MTDEDYMAEALRLAETGLGRVAPNPSVGCIIIKDGEIVGQARTADGGRPHAEVLALEMAGDKAKGATVYVTLEPCCHHGQTLPCTDSLIAAKVSKIFVACKDEDRRVAGQGIRALQDMGISVVVGLLEQEARALNEGFFRTRKNFRSLVTLKMAVSVDSKIAAASGQSQWITGEESRARGQVERSRHDAILTGIGTILKDDPLLTTRIAGVSHKSVRVVLDTQFRFPLAAKMIATKDRGDIWIYTAPNVDKNKKDALEKLGLRVIEIDLNATGQLSIPFVLEHLASEGITRVMVEAGQKVFSSFIKMKLWDNLLLFRAPYLLGHEGIDAFGVLDIPALDKAIALQLMSMEPHGDDLLEIYKNPATKFS